MKLIELKLLEFCFLEFLKFDVVLLLLGLVLRLLKFDCRKFVLLKFDMNLLNRLVFLFLKFDVILIELL